MSAPVSRDPLVVNTRDGVVWLRRGLTRDGRGLYAVTDSCRCPVFVMASLADLAEDGIVGSADVLPVPVGPRLPPFPPAAGAFEGKLRQDVARLQGLLAEAVADKHRAQRERDLIRERVAEPYGCALCGVAKRAHGRRYITGAGVHVWERPSDTQVKERMLARRAVCADVKGLRAYRDGSAEPDTLGAWLYQRFMADGDGWDNLDADQRSYWEHQARAVRRAVERGGFKAAPSVAESADALTRLIAPTQAALEDPHDSPLHRTYEVCRDLPETGGNS